MSVHSLLISQAISFPSSGSPRANPNADNPVNVPFIIKFIKCDNYKLLMMKLTRINI